MQVPEWFVTLSLWINKITYRDFFAGATVYTGVLYLLNYSYAALVFFFTMLGVLGSVGVLKVLTQVERPQNALIPQKYSRHAFPSGHAAAAAFVAAMVPYTAPWGFYELTSLVLVVFALVVGASRLVLRAHTLFQVVAGAVLGVLLPYLITWLVDPRLVERILSVYDIVSLVGPLA